MGGFADYVQELFEGLGPVRVKRMFGGLGVWAGSFDDKGVMFALVDQEVIYLKTDEALKRELEAEGSAPWVYSRRDGWKMETSYWRLPETALDDPDEAVAWARKSLAAALAKAAQKPPKRKKA
ncbi:TfoX/Sxy family protein [Phenylobacterium sp.]|jgi:DNA transformation protein|uniref:TfoX/Sxy family protein n=1 Tax=Phenylobacterium sp. TaxID=1871053 RepID=UPI002F418991